MTPPVPPEVRGQIFALKSQNKSAHVVRKELLALKIDVSERSIRRLWKKNCLEFYHLREPNHGKKAKDKSCTYTGSHQKSEASDRYGNPMTQEIMGKRVGVSRQIIGKIIAQDLALKRLKKPTAKFLTDAMVGKRKKRAKPFKNKIRKMLDYMLTLDEAILPNDHSNGQTDHYYAKKNISERGRPVPIATSQQQFPEQYMMCGGFSMRYPT